MPKKIILMFSDQLHPIKIERIRETITDLVTNQRSSVVIIDQIPGDVKALTVDSDTWAVDIVTGKPAPEKPRRSRKPKETIAINNNEQ